MINVSQKRKKSKLNQKYSELNYWKSIKEEVSDLFSLYDLELSNVIDSLSGKEHVESEETGLSVIEEEKPEPQSKNEEFDSTEDVVDTALENKNVPAWMKKAFKAIAIKTHPDKVLVRNDISENQKQELLEYYAAAANAIAEVNRLELIEIARALDVEIEIDYEEQIKMLENKIVKIKKEIAGYQTMASWHWGESEGNINVRTNLVIQVMNYLNLRVPGIEEIKKKILKFEGLDVEEKEEELKKTKDKNRFKKRKVGTRPGPSIGSQRKKWK